MLQPGTEYPANLKRLGFTQKAWIKVTEKEVEFWFEPEGMVAKQDLKGFISQPDPLKGIRVAWFFIMRKKKFGRYKNQDKNNPVKMEKGHSRKNKIR